MYNRCGFGVFLFFVCVCFLGVGQEGKVVKRHPCQGFPTLVVFQGLIVIFQAINIHASINKLVV